MKNRVGVQDKKRRCAELASAASAKKEELLGGLVGEKLSVLFETRDERGWTGHSDNFAEVVCDCEGDLRGRVCECLAIASDGGRLTAVLL